jgi:hypothetical protein
MKNKPSLSSILHAQKCQFAVDINTEISMASNYRVHCHDLPLLGMSLPFRGSLQFSFYVQVKDLRRIDVHHHFFPASLNKRAASAAVGFRTPESSLPWTPEVSLKSMDSMNIQTAILCLPLIAAGSVGMDNRTKMREHNLYAHQVCKEHPGRFSFFAAVGFLDDIEGDLQCAGR